jgi:hypothetical protein
MYKDWNWLIATGGLIAICEYIELKNGTLIPKGLCYTTYNYILKCINKSEVKGIVTK